MKRFLPSNVDRVGKILILASIDGLLVGILLGFLVGCGGPLPVPTKAPVAHSVGYGGPASGLFKRPGPQVVFIGDSIVTALITPAVLSANPSWQVQGSPAGVVQETAEEVGARFYLAVAAQPKVIVIEAGTWDLEQIGELNCEAPCGNIGQMALDAEDAGISVIVCSIPPMSPGSLTAETYGNEPPWISIDEFNQSIGLNGVPSEDFVFFPPMYGPKVTFLDLHQLLGGGPGGPTDYDNTKMYQPRYTDDGINPNAEAYSAIAPTMIAAINAALGVN